MPDCDYCDQSFADEDAHLEHLAEEHYDELGRIDKRRVDRSLSDGESEQPVGLIAGVAVVAILLLVGVGFLLLSGGGGGGDGQQGAPTPHALGSVHYHGTLVMTVDGARVDFSKDKYQLQDDYFHFERGNGKRWHAHGKGITLQYAMDTLGIHVTKNSVKYQGTTYRDSDANTNVSITVDGKPVTPSTYVLEEGDEVRVVVETSG